MRLDGRALGAAAAGSLAFGYVLCVILDLALRKEMYRAWTGLLPGFHWISWGSFVLGLVETIGYGFFFGLIFAPLYKFFLANVWKEERA